MSKLVINNLPENKELDRQALAEFKGGFNPSNLLEQITAEAANKTSGYTLDQVYVPVSVAFSRKIFVEK